MPLVGLNTTETKVIHLNGQSTMVGDIPNYILNLVQQ